MNQRRPDPSEFFPPHSRLFIYYIEGTVHSAGLEPETTFIGNWEEEGFSFLFFSESRDEVVEALVADSQELSLVDRYTMSYEEWLGERFDGFETEGLFVRPPWTPSREKAAGERSPVEIILDPGVVFGTGSHATTRDCLRAIFELFRTVEPGIVLDLGTGSGLLALAAAKLGARKVVAVDLNFLASRTAQRNVRLNREDSRVLAVQGRAETFMGCRADLLIANIHYDVMKQLVRSPGFLNISYFILSGLMRSEARAVESMLGDLPVGILRRWEADGVWFTYMGQVTSS